MFLLVVAVFIGVVSAARIHRPLHYMPDIDDSDGFDDFNPKPYRPSSSTPECDNVLGVLTDKRGRLYTPVDFPYYGGTKVEFRIKSISEKRRGQDPDQLELILIDQQPIDGKLKTRIYYPQHQNNNPIIAKVEWNDRVYCANDPGDELLDNPGSGYVKNILRQRFRFYWEKK